VTRDQRAEHEDAEPDGRRHQASSACSLIQRHMTASAIHADAIASALHDAALPQQPERGQQQSQQRAQRDLEERRLHRRLEHRRHVHPHHLPPAEERVGGRDAEAERDARCDAAEHLSRRPHDDSRPLQRIVDRVTDVFPADLVGEPERSITSRGCERTPSSTAVPSARALSTMSSSARSRSRPRQARRACAR
jgi:hypothetical protein